MELKWNPGEKTAFIATGKYWVNNHAHVLKLNRKKIIDELLVYFLNQHDLTSFITGITVPKLNQKQLLSIKIPLPPLEVQREVVAEIEGWQKIIDGQSKWFKTGNPPLKINPSWPMVELGKVCKTISPAKKIPKKDFHLYSSVELKKSTLSSLKSGPFSKTLSPLQIHHFCKNQKSKLKQLYPIIDQSQNEIAGWTNDRNSYTGY